MSNSISVIIALLISIVIIATVTFREIVIIQLEVKEIKQILETNKQ